MTDRLLPLRTGRLRLEPLVAAHADAMYALLKDPALYRHMDGDPPPSAEHLRGIYGKLESRSSPDGSQGWFNWVVSTLDGPPVGYVQATVAGELAWIAYVVGSAHQGRGYAREATAAMIDHLGAEHGVRRFLAVAEADNRPSLSLLHALGFRGAGDAESRAHDLSPTERLFVRGDPIATRLQETS
jgi:RimJ/RimL family protein N-acetyltransferase